MEWYRGKKVYVVGGSQGIGRAAAVQLAGAGAHVWVGARNRAQLDETVEAMRAAGNDGQTFGASVVDVTDAASVKTTAAAVLAGLGGLDVLVCNQGYAHTGYIQQLDDEHFDAMIQTNYLGHVRVTRSFLQHFVEQGSGHICLVSSMLGFMGLFGYAAYSGSKHAVAGYARCLRQDLLPAGIRVTVFYPPTTDTPGLERENENKPPETWALESSSRKFTADQVAASMLRATARGKFEAVCGADSWFIWMASRYAPWVVHLFTDSDLRKYLRKKQLEVPTDGQPRGEA